MNSTPPYRAISLHQMPIMVLAHLQPLMSRFLLFDMLLDIADDHAIVLFQRNRGSFDHVGFGQFSRCIVGHRNDANIRNGRMRQQMCFKLCRCDLKTLKLDQH